MAGDWIKIDIATPDKPEIDKMATILKLDHDSVLGKCVRVWIWADLQSVDGNALSVTESFLDRLTYCPGFASSLRQVGWLSGKDGHLMIPNFDRHNGQTAKNRALTGKRVQKSRNAASVTKSLPEKRREEKSISNTETQGNDAVASSVPQSVVVNAVNAAPVKAHQRPRPVFVKPTVSDVIAYVLEIKATVDAKTFCDYYESNGWRVGRNPMKDWKATVRQWQNRNQQGSLYGNERAPVGNSAAAKETRNASAFSALQIARERAGISVSAGVSGGGPVSGNLTHKTLLDEEAG